MSARVLVSSDYIARFLFENTGTSIVGAAWDSHRRMLVLEIEGVHVPDVEMVQVIYTERCRTVEFKPIEKGN